MRVFVKTASFYLGVNPTATPVKLDAHAQPVRDAHGHTIPASGDDVFPVYYGRPGEKNEGGAWETVDLESLGDGTFSALFVESNRQLSIGDDGSLQTRAAGAVGPWETFFATSQPDGLNLLYRVKDGVPVGMLLLEAA